MANPNRQFYVPTKYHHFPVINNPNVLCSMRVNGTAQTTSAGRIDYGPLSGDSGWVCLDRVSFLPKDIVATGVSYLNNWADYDAATYTAGSYYKDSKNILHLEGLTKRTIAWANSIMFALPAGSYNTDYQGLYTVLTAAGLGRVDIDTSGNVWSLVGSATWTSLDGLQVPIGASWTNVSYVNSWVDYGSGYCPGSYYKDADNIVHLRGLVKNGTVGAVIFTLPVGYRPNYHHLFAVVSNSAVARCDVYSDGNVSAATGSNAWFSLDGIHFPAGTPPKLTVPPFVNYWANYSAGTWESASYFRDSAGIIRVQGLIAGSWLPVGTSTLNSSRTCCIIRDEAVNYSQVEPLG